MCRQKRGQICSRGPWRTWTISGSALQEKLRILRSLPCKSVPPQSHQQAVKCLSQTFRMQNTYAWLSKLHSRCTCKCHGICWRRSAWYRSFVRTGAGLYVWFYSWHFCGVYLLLLMSAWLMNTGSLSNQWIWAPKLAFVNETMSLLIIKFWCNFAPASWIQEVTM